MPKLESRDVVSVLNPTDMLWIEKDNGSGVYDKTERMSFSDFQGAMAGATDILYTDLFSLMETNQLIPQAFYNITDRDIIIQAYSTNQLNSSAHRKMRIVQNTYYTSSGVNKGVWSSGLTVSIGDFVIWGGRVWQNLTGAIGSNLSYLNLDVTNWVMIATTDETFYKDKVFFVIYDFMNDIVKVQMDDNNNVMIYDASPLGDWIKHSDWGDNSIKNNYTTGIINNRSTSIVNNRCVFSVLPAIYRNISGSINNNNVGGVIKNNCGSIVGNINQLTSKPINGNVISGSIIQNICRSTGTYFIEGNTNNGDISNNFIHYIRNCSNMGDIRNNANNGYIENIGSANDNIINNINNGNITTTTTGDISDAIVNK